MTIRRRRHLLGLLATLALAFGSCADATGPRPSAQLEQMVGDGQAGAAGGMLPAPLVIVVTDGRGSPLSEVPVRWGAAVGGGTLTPAFGFTDAEGRAAARWTLGPRAGEQAARVAVTGMAPLTFTARAVPTDPAQVRLQHDTIRLGAFDDTARLSVEVADQFGNRIPSPSVVWTLSDPSVVALEADGVLRARANGVTRLIARAGTQADTATVVVQQAVASVALSARADSLMVGDSMRIAFVLADANGFPVEGRRIAWISSNPAAARVDSAGVLHALGMGSVTLTALADNAVGELVVSLRVPKYRLSVARLELDGIGASATVRGVMRGQLVAPQRLRVVAEQRWLGEAPVLGADALAQGQIRASGAGAAWVEASVDGAAPDTLLVRIAPRRPLVHRMVLPEPGEAGPVRLRGFGMLGLDVGRIRVGGQPVVGSVRDSATVEFHVPAHPNLACGTPAPLQVALDDADASTPLVIDRPVVEPISLRVGEAMQLSAEQVACLRLPAAPYARYALAFADARAPAQARTHFADATQLGAPTVRVRDLTGRLGGALPPPQRVQPSFDRAGGRGAYHAVTEAEAAAAGHWHRRTSPWLPDERFAFGGGEAHVVRIHDDRYVVATDAPGASTPAWAARLDSAMTAVQRHGVPLLRHALSPAVPSTAAAEQLLIVVSRGAPAPAAYGYLPRVAAGEPPLEPRALIVVPEEAVARGSVAELIELLMQPLAYAWQARYLYDSAGDARNVDVQPADWAREGTAALLVKETLRRHAAVPHLANFDWHQALRQNAPPALRAYAALAARAGSAQARGDEHTADFLADLAARRIAFGGETPETAMREVIRGALDGWHGIDRSGTRRTGLTQRMRERLGPRWEPAQALLVWVVSQALDDRTANEQFQNPAKLYAAREGTAAWQPVAQLAGGSFAAAEVTWSSGGAQYFVLEDLGSGGSFHVDADVEGIVWMLARVY